MFPALCTYLHQSHWVLQSDILHFLGWYIAYHHKLICNVEEMQSLKSSSKSPNNPSSYSYFSLPIIEPTLNNPSFASKSIIYILYHVDNILCILWLQSYFLGSYDHIYDHGVVLFFDQSQFWVMNRDSIQDLIQVTSCTNLRSWSRIVENLENHLKCLSRSWQVSNVVSLKLLNTLLTLKFEITRHSYMFYTVDKYLDLSYHGK